MQSAVCAWGSLPISSWLREKSYGQKSRKLGVRGLSASLLGHTRACGGRPGSKEAISQAIAGIRDRVILATKVSGQHLQLSAVIRAAGASLQRLKTDYIDPYQIHWPGSLELAHYDESRPNAAP